MNRFTGWLKEFLDNMPSTNARIATSLFLCVVYVVAALAADIAGKHLSDGTINTIGLFLMGMLGADVGQFLGKRFSDSSYAAAKFSQPSPAPPPPAPIIAGAVSVEAPPGGLNTTGTLSDGRAPATAPTPPVAPVVPDVPLEVPPTKRDE